MKDGTSGISGENHTLLVQLNDAVTAMGKQVGQHIEQQTKENVRLHERIDGVQVETRNGVDAIKASLASSGKVTASNIFALIAVLVSVMALVGGIAQAYISVRLGNITPLIDANMAQIEQVRTEQHRQREELTLTRIEAARVDEARRWMEKFLEANTR